MKESTYLIPILHTQSLPHLKSFCQSSILHNIQDPILILFLYKNDFHFCYSHLENYLPSIPLQFFILEDYFSFSQISSISPSLLSTFLLYYSFLVLSPKYHSFIHLSLPFSFSSSISLFNILQSFESNFTLYTIDTHECNIEINSYLSLFLPIQQKMIQMKIQNASFSNSNYHIFHSHYLSSFFSFFQINSSDFLSSIQKFNTSPDPFIPYILFLILHKHIHIYSLSTQLQLPPSLSLFQPSDWNYIQQFIQEFNIQHLTLPNI